MLQFMRNLVGVKADKAVQAGVEALVRWDPQSASEAEMRSMEQNLDQLGQQVARARLSYDKEMREANAIQALSTQRMAAADQLQRQAEAETDPAKKAELERSLGTLVTMLEQMAPEVDREKKDVVDAKEFLEMLEKTYAEAGGKLREGRAARARTARHGARRSATADGRAAGRCGTPGSRAEHDDHQPERGAEGDAGRGRARPHQRRGRQHEGKAAQANATRAGRCEHRAGDADGLGTAGRRVQSD